MTKRFEIIEVIINRNFSFFIYYASPIKEIEETHT
jgi:hypothetical protein